MCPIPPYEPPSAEDRQLTHEISTSAAAIVRREHAEGPPARRDQHAKHHGCLWAYFDVLPNVPERVRGGLFATPGHYRAWVRFSNSSSGTKPDTEIDGRGVALKLLDVPGKRLQPDGVELDEATQDFILLNHSAFFAEDLEEMTAIFAWLAAGKSLPSYLLSRLRLRGLWAIFKLAVRPDSPLALTYFSQLPFACGLQNEPIKYRLRPLTGIEPLEPTRAEKRSGNHLQHVLRRQLVPNARDRDMAQQGIEANHGGQPGDVVFSFEVQGKTPKDDRDRGNVSWSGPFTQVALLRIPRQDFDHPDRMAFAENMAFNVWNGIEDHLPLGDLNGARAKVYDHIKTLRNELNGVEAPRYTADVWAKLRKLPAGPAPTLDHLSDVMDTLTPPLAGLPAKLLGSRVGPWIPAFLLALIVSLVLLSPEQLGKPLSIGAPLRALGLTMPSEDLIPPAKASGQYLKRLRAQPPGYDPQSDPVWLFRYGSMGAEFSAGIPYWIYRVLPRIAPDQFDTQDDWSAFGLSSPDDHAYYADYHGLPRGLVLADTVARIGNQDLEIPLKRVALNCASCHRGEVINSKGESEFVDGMPNLTFDAASFKRQTVAAFTAPTFTVTRVLDAIDEELAAEHRAQGRQGSPAPLNPLERLVYTRIVQFMQKGAHKKEPLLRWLDIRPANGPGRLDAFGALRFESLGFTDPLPSNENRKPEPLLIATVDLPSIWNQGPDRPRHHYDGNTADARARNVGAIVGVGGHPLSVRFESVQRIGTWIDHELKSPRYQLAPLDPARVARGKETFEKQCTGCHGQYDDHGTLTDLTDCMQAASKNIANTDQARLRAVDTEFVSKLNQFGVRNGLWEETSFEASKGYLCPPLDGIWARAPYLHNGSIPTLEHLLSGQRPTKFLRGNPRYDTERGGFVFEDESGGTHSSFVFDTSCEGNSNGGHDTPKQLVPDARQRRDLIEYLYTL